MEATRAWIESFVSERGLTREVVISKVNEVISVTEDTLDYVAAGIDASTNYFTHTGVQTLAREMAVRAHAEIKDEVWSQWVEGL